jgi:CYTH domain-containing protein
MTYTNGLITQETWTDSATSYLRKRKDYTYSNGKIATIRIRIYSTNDGTTLDIDFTETLAYDVNGMISGSSTTRVNYP